MKDDGTQFPKTGNCVNGSASCFDGKDQNDVTLRDYFAAKAMQALILIDGHEKSMRGIADDAYLYALAMIKTREVTK